MQIAHDNSDPQIATLETWEPVVVDASSWPILFVRYPAVLTLDAVEDYMGQLVPLLTRGVAERVRLAAVIDVRRVAPAEATSKVRAHLAQRLDEAVAAHPSLCASSVVSDSAVLRGLVTAVQWLRPNSQYPIRCFDRADQGLAWAREQVERK